jgi:hypothetical protein
MLKLGAMKQYSRKGRAIVLDLLILFVLSIIPALLSGTDLIPDTVIDLQLDPVDALTRSLFMWDSRVFAGYSSSALTPYIFPVYSFFAFFSIFGLHAVIVERIWWTFIFFLSETSMYYLMSICGGKRISKIVPAMFYMLNPYILLGMHEIGRALLLPYAVLPLILGLYIKGMSTEKNTKYAVLLGFSSLLISGVNLPLTMIAVLILTTYFVFDFLVFDRKYLSRKIKFSLIAILLILFINLWWIAPAIYRITTGEWLQAFRSDSIEIQSLHSSFAEVIRLLGLWAFYEGYKGVAYVSFAHCYINNPLLIAVSYLIPILAFSVLFTAPRNKYVLYFSILAVIAIPLAVGIYPSQDPSLTGKVFMWAYNNLPFFKIFRSIYKFVSVLCLTYSFMLGYLVAKVYPYSFSSPGRIALKLSDRLVKVKRIISKVPIFLILCLILVNSWPLVTGNWFEAETKIRIPSYYYQAASWLNQQNDDFRIFSLPQQYFAVYSWGHLSGDITPSLFKKRQILMYPVPPPSPYTANLTCSIYELISQNSTPNIGKLLGLLNVKYILQRNDVDWKFYNVESPQLVKSVLSSQVGIYLERTFGEIDFYRNEHFLPFIYTTTNATLINGGIEAMIIAIVGGEYSQSHTVTYSQTEDFSYVNRTFQDVAVKVNAKIVSGDCLSIMYYLNDNNWYSAQLRTDDSHIEKAGAGKIGTSTGFKASTNVWYNLKFLKNGTHLVLYVNEQMVAEAIDPTVTMGKIGLSTSNTNAHFDDFMINPLNGTELLYDNFNTYSKDSNGSPTWVHIGGLWKVIPSTRIEGDSFDLSDGERVLFLSEYLDPEQIMRVKQLSKYNLIENPIIQYEKIDPTRYIIHITNASNPFFLVFSESYHEDWVAYIDGQQIPNEYHFTANGYANAWYINKTGPYTITLEFWPQKLFYIGSAVSITALITCVLYLSKNKPKTTYKGHMEKNKTVKPNSKP